MKRSIFMAAAVIAIGFTTSSVFAQTTQDTTRKTTTTTSTTTAAAADGASDVVGALASNADYSTALAAVKAAKLDSVLKAGGPYTIFAPNNISFGNLPAGKLDSLLKDPVTLATLLKGHVVMGKYGKKEIIAALTAGKGKATVTTLDGQPLTLSLVSNKLQLTNAAGSTAQVTLFDLIGANGVVNGLNGILMPKP
ncbi:fasciclin domain-containing protein [Mucilaginibacter psychrotolerans]|uniref:Fasciclin domain-containing protein n=1 Tax=Mucilaginibacter psychrotolerans TaxID=1524096 RepID=A0A4Y8SCL0_9SPHI|nr:fasciclin domain-containing protein [Mucilaginibacter psychrotolerans]TFF36355.1 fasciclin domain-containing protein [Mucilaginibacter psychrotolerans]